MLPMAARTRDRNSVAARRGAAIDRPPHPLTNEHLEFPQNPTSDFHHARAAGHAARRVSSGMATNEATDMVRHFRFLTLFLLLLSSLAALAQKNPNHEVGFKPGNVYDQTDVDTVNLFNGNVTLNIPIGPRYQVGPTLSYQFQLTANSLGTTKEVWDCEQPGHPICEELYPNLASNAGIGWRLSLGELLAPTAVGPTSRYRPGYFLYVSPSGAEYRFDDDPVSFSNARYGSTDRPQLRMVMPDGIETIRDIEFPNGEIHRYERTAISGGVPSAPIWRLTSIRDRKSESSPNKVTIAYLPLGSEPKTSWQITDTVGRTHEIQFAYYADMQKGNNLGQQATSVQLSGYSQPYTLDLKRSADLSGCAFNGSADIAFLKKLTQPDGTAYSFGPTGNCHGWLSSFTLPTGATVSYEFGDQYATGGQDICYYRTDELGQVGLKSRTVTNGSSVRVWKYAQLMGPRVPLTYQLTDPCNWLVGPLIPTPPSYWSRVSVISPADPEGKHTRQDHYFSVMPDDLHTGEITDPLTPPGYGNGYGSPGSAGMPPPAWAKGKAIPDISPFQPGWPDDVSGVDGSGSIVSQLYGDCDSEGDCTNGTLLRSVYHDGASPQPSWAKTVLHDETNCDTLPCYTLVTRSDPDYTPTGNEGQLRVHHFRQEEAGSNIRGALGRKTVTDYHKWTKTELDSVLTWYNTTPFASRTTTENGVVAAKEQFCHDPISAFLTRHRVWAGASPTTKDVINVFEPSADDKWNVARQSTYGGYAQSVSVSEDLCALTLPATPEFKIVNTYANGIGLRLNEKTPFLVTSKFVNPSSDASLGFFSVDRTIDVATGAVKEIRDTTGLATVYGYSAANGRLETITRPGGPATKIEYTNATGSNAQSRPSVLVRQWPAAVDSGAVLTEERYHYDLLGRLIQERRRMPGSVWSVSETRFDLLDRQDSRTVPVSSGTSDHSSLPGTTPATKWVYDSLDRPRFVTMPDLSTSEVRYDGISKLWRSAKIATSDVVSTWKTVWTREDRDWQGQLVGITENAPSPDAADQDATIVNGAPVLTTSYEYDRGGRLAKVSSGVQTRTFTHDLAGRLTQETHPESGTTDYQYDSMGNVTTRDGETAVLTYEFDKASRLNTVSDGTGAIKEFTFGSSTADSDRSLGKVKTASRHNRLPSLGDIVVTETFTYGRPGGRISEKVTTTGTETFTDNYTYDPLGNLEEVTYPACTGCPVTTPVRKAKHSYDNGLLDKVEQKEGPTGTYAAVASGFKYHANGLLLSLSHHNAKDNAIGPVQTQTVDETNGMPRPASISVSGYCPDFKIDTQPAPVTMSGGSAPLNVVAAGATTWEWFAGTATTAFANTSAITVSPATAQTYWVRVGNGTCTVDSRVVLVTVPCNLITTQPADQTISNGKATFTIAVNGSATVKWYEGAVGNTTTLRQTGGLTFQTPTLQATTQYWAQVTGPSCVENSVQVSAILQCATPVITSSAATVGAGTTFQLNTQLVSGATYKWFKNGHTTPVLIGMTTVPTFSVTGGITSHTLFHVEVSDNGCYVTPARSATITVSVCLPPGDRAITASVETPTTFRLRVSDFGDGTTFQWYEGTSYADLSKPAGTGSSILVPVEPRTYWVRMTRSCGALQAVADTPFYTPDTGCIPSIIVQPKSQSVQLPAVGASVSMTAKVVAGERGPFTYQWFRTDGLPLNHGYETGDSYTWTYTGLASERLYSQQKVFVIVTGCGGATIKSDVITLTATTTPQQLGVSGGGAHYGFSKRLGAYMDPVPSAVHEYTYEWYQDDGTPGGAKIAFIPEIGVIPSPFGIYWAKVTGTHEVGPDPNGNFGEYTETSVSEKLHVYQYGTCELPPVKVAQDFGAVSEVSPQPVVFQAYIDLPSADLQWYAGISGDTREPIAADTHHDDRLTVSSSPLQPYWVRASRDCGGFVDSKTLYFTRGGCGPVIFEQRIASADVAYGGAATLKAPAVAVENPKYTWLREEPRIIVGNGAELPLTNVTASGRYFVRIESLGCNSVSESFTAAVRVASCPGLTPQWTTEFWTDKGSAAQLAATVTGATSYQWYEGEVGDHNHPIGGATSSTFTTPNLSADKQYWVSASGGGCRVDSPTITAKVCTPPVNLGAAHNDYYSTVHGQGQHLSVRAEGTALQYQWFEGTYPDQSKPGRTTDITLVHPTVTTNYWVKVTSRCGVGGNAPRVLLPAPTSKVSVCASYTQPVAAKSIIMPGTATTVSLTANGTDLSFRWYKGQSGDYANPIPNSNSASIPTGTLSATTTFWCEIKSGICPRQSDGVTVSVCEIPNVYFIGGNLKKLQKSQYVTLSLSNVPDVPRSYQWYVGETGTTTQPWSTQASVGVSPTVTTKGWVRVTFIDTGCYVDSPTMTLDVCIPQVTTQPQPMRIDPGGTATMTVAADLPVTYQWYAGQPGDTTKPVVGQTTATLSVQPAVPTFYWARVKGSCDITRDSEAAEVTICQPPVITHEPNAMNGPRSTGVTFNVGATGTELTYQWYKGLKGDTSAPFPGKTTAQPSLSTATTIDVWVRVSGACGSVDSRSVKFSVPPLITTQPTGGTVMPNSIRTVTTLATGTELSYQWYRVVGSTTTLLTGATGTSYTTPALTVDTTYYCLIKSGNNSAQTVDATFTVCQLPILNWGSVDTETTPSQFQNVGVSVSGIPAETARSFQWYRGPAGDTSTPISTQSAIGISPTVTTTYWVRVTLTDSGCWADSTAKTVKVCVQSITAQPAATTTIDKVTNPSAFAHLTVATDLPGNTYQWYIGQPGVTTTPVANATTAAYDASPAADTTYWVRVTGTCGIVRDSTAAQVIVCQPPAIASHPPSFHSASGAARTLSVSASGTELTYAWFKGTTGVTTTPIGSNASSVTVAPTSTTDYWVRVTGRCGVVSSNTAKISIAAGITTEPAGGPITSGTTRTLTVVATGTQLSYQWYQRSGTSEVLIGGATGASYTTPPIVADATYFCRITSGTSARDSADATLTVCLPQSIATQNQSQVSGNPVTLYVANPPADESYEWYRGATGNTTAPIGNGTNVVSVAPLETTQYWVRTKRAGCDADTPAITIRICRPKITTQPVGGMIASGTTKTLTVAATGTGPMTYQWYAGAQGVMTNPVAGATSATFTPPPLTADTSYWVRISTPPAGCGTNYTDATAVTVTVCQPPAIQFQPMSQTIASTTTITLSVTASGEGLQYQWYEGTAGVTTKPVGGGVNSYSVRPGTTKSYWVRITGTCGTLDSQVALISVLPTITAQPVEAGICNLGESPTFTVTASGTGLTYQWYRKYGSAAWEMVGTQTATVSIPIAQVPVYIYCAVKSGNATTSTTYVGATVNPKPGLTHITIAAYGAPGYYKLSSQMPVEDRDLVTYKWYEGPLGNTTTLLFDGSYPTAIVNPVPRPKAYWVRVTYTDTGCYTDRAVTVN
jgi:YD repeat-containing protein